MNTLSLSSRVRCEWPCGLCKWAPFCLNPGADERSYYGASGSPRIVIFSCLYHANDLCKGGHFDAVQLKIPVSPDDDIGFIGYANVYCKGLWPLAQDISISRSPYRARCMRCAQLHCLCQLGPFCLGPGSF